MQGIQTEETATPWKEEHILLNGKLNPFENHASHPPMTPDMFVHITVRKAQYGRLA